jgi:ABC-type Fe3+/spermidine/putrescine transport system ATPase subunit
MGNDVIDLPPEKRKVGMVFQNYALFPHMNVLKNVMYGIHRRRKDPRSYARKMLGIVGLQNLEERPVYLLSGGQEQRVALARALAHDPEVLLLDEPLSALDASLREGLRKDLRSILKERGVTSLYITHDQMEALSISDRIGFLRSGKIFEEGTPEELFWRPERIETARFMGVANILKVQGSSEGLIRTSIGKIPWEGKVPDRIGFRPLSFKAGGEGQKFRCKVTSLEYRGSEVHLELKYKGVKLKGTASGKLKPSKGEKIEMGLSPEGLVPFYR